MTIEPARTMGTVIIVTTTATDIAIVHSMAHWRLARSSRRYRCSTIRCGGMVSRITTMTTFTIVTTTTRKCIKLCSRHRV